MSCLLIIACYGGPRRMAGEGQECDRALYLKQWAHALSVLSTDCDVVFASNGGDEDYSAFLDEQIRPFYCVVGRLNIGYSQGAWAQAWRGYPGYDYYILFEDDYLPVLDHFDREMITEFEKAPATCGFLCQFTMTRPSGSTATEGPEPPFPAIQNGIASGECLRAMGGLPGESVGYYPDACEAQIKLGKWIRYSGFSCHDMGKRFRAPFWVGGEEGIIWYHRDAPELLAVPSQIYEG